MFASPRHRWLRPHFSLATLFVVVAALGVWLGLQATWIRHRHELLKSTSFFFPVEGDGYQAPLSLWLLGEPGVRYLLMWNDAEGDVAETLRRARELFPEAHVGQLPPEIL